MPPIIHTLTGSIDLEAPRPEDINIEDIAWSLACNPRFNAHTRWKDNRAFYSVAEHSVLVSQCPQIRETRGKLIPAWALLHDAFEAYAHDVIRPLRDEMISTKYATWESAFYAAVSKKFNLFPITTVRNSWLLSGSDDAMLDCEIAFLTNIPQRQPLIGWTRNNPWETRPPYSTYDAYEMFLSRAEELGLYKTNTDARNHQIIVPVRAALL